MEYRVMILLFVLLISCKPENKENQNLKRPSSPKMIITNYTGNAVAFFAEDGRDIMIFIPVQEKDSNVFKKENFDIYKAIECKCGVRMMIYGLWIRLVESKYRKVLDHEVCNVIDETHYVKIWISYTGYIEGPYRYTKEPQTDSCAIRHIHSMESDTAKILDFKILGE